MNAPVVNLVELRVNRGLSCAEAARQIGVSRTTLDRAERGEGTPSPRHALKIARFYDFEKVTDIWPVGEAAAA